MTVNSAFPEDDPPPGLARLLARAPGEGRGARLRAAWAEAWDGIARAPLPELVVWGPVGVAVGAALGCTLLAAVPPAAAVGALALLGLAGAGAQLAGVRQGREWMLWLGLVLLMGAALAGGCASVLLRAQVVAAPVIAAEGGPRQLAGTVIEVDRAQSGAWRAMLVVDAIDGLAPDRTPRRVRISLREDKAPAVGTRLSCVATLNPPPAPVVPGAYDFARAAWFKQLGAVGYALRPCAALPAVPAEGLLARIGSWLSAARQSTAADLAEGHGGAGGFLAAIATGDRSWLDPVDVEALQASGLAHIVSVSGLHVALVSGLVFLAVWRGLALWPWVALRVDARKPAAAAAFAAALAYTVFTGAEAPAVRACVMTAVVLGAVMLDRQGVTRRGLAIAALLILAFRPESAMEPGFQMSFLATLALVSLWEAARPGATGTFAILRDPRGWVAATLLAGVVAGAATAPVAASVFHRVSPWSMAANLMAAPLQDFVVAPAALTAVVLSPFGWDEPFWQLARWGLDRILDIAHWVAVWPGAGASVADAGPVPPLLLVAAIVILCLARTVLRWLAVPLAALGLCLWWLAPPVEGWIAPQGRAFLAAPAGSWPQLCFLPGARFDAVRLVDEAGLPARTARAVVPPPRTRGDDSCLAGGSDWTLHFEPDGTGDLRPVLTVQGLPRALSPDELPGGGLLLRRGQSLDLLTHAPAHAPWNRARASGGAGGEAVAELVGER